MLKLSNLIEAVKWLAYTVFWVALGIGTYVRWFYLYESNWIVSLAILSSSASGMGLLLRIRSTSTYLLEISTFLITFFPSFMLGIIAFTHIPAMEEDLYEWIMKIIFLASFAIYFMWVSSSRTTVSSTALVIMKSQEFNALFGLASAIVATEHINIGGLLCCLVYIGILIFSLHRHHVLPLLTLPLFIILCMKSILPDPSNVNREALAVFAMLMVFEPLLNVFICPSPSLDAWIPMLGKPLCLFRLTSVIVMFVEISLMFLVGFSLRHHKEWMVVMPIFAACAVFLWLPFHIAYFIVNWKLWSRVHKGVEILKTDLSRTLPHILSSRGVRHFSLITYPLMWLNLLVTLLQCVWSWTTKTDLTSGLLLICLPVQLILINFLRVLCVQLGGTCCGYALVTPAVLRSQDDSNLREVQNSTSFATRTIRLIQDFFNHHLIADGGCEYLSDRMTEAALYSKIIEFFSMKSEQGDAFDSYLLYYSGPVNQAGDWLLKGEGVLTYGKLITWWLDHEVSRTSRLLLVLDTAKSNYWVPLVRKTTASHVGIQTIYVRREAEMYNEFNIGDFTRDWVDYNCNKDSEIYSSTFTSPIVVTYGISAYWSDFTFREPSEEEVDKHWREYFNFRMRPLIKLLSLFDRKRLCCLCNCVGRWVSLIKLWLFTPTQLDIGHGFKLVRFFKVPGGGLL